MKAILEFDLPKDQEDYLVAQSARSMACALHAMYSCLRENTKHGITSEFRGLTEEDLMDKIFDHFTAILSDYNVSDVIFY